MIRSMPPDKRMLHAVSDAKDSCGYTFGPLFFSRAIVTTDVSVSYVVSFGISVGDIEIGLTFNRRIIRDTQ